MNPTKMIFEVVPPGKMLSAQKKADAVSALSSAISPLDAISAINIPEVVDENTKGHPYYRNEDACIFAGQMRQKSSKDVIVNKVVAHSRGAKEFEDWLDNAVSAHGIKKFIFVGGSKSSNRYPGPSVIEATKLALEKHDIRAGSILIPSRENESGRMLEKTLAGTSFFTTQILFSSDSIKNVLSGYKAKCDDAGVETAEVFLSFSTLSNAHDLEFVKWLGADIPQDVEKKLLSSGAGISQNSIDAARGIWHDVSDFLADKGLKISTGVNVESVFMHNLSSSIEMAKQFAQSMKQRAI